MKEWFVKKQISFELSVLYSQEHNGVSEQIGKAIIDMTRAIILEKKLEEELWSKIILAITYIKNVCSTKVLNKDNPYNAQQKSQPNIQHLWVLESTVYILLYEEEQALKFEKLI